MVYHSVLWDEEGGKDDRVLGGLLRGSDVQKGDGVHTDVSVQYVLPWSLVRHDVSYRSLGSMIDTLEPVG